MKGRELLRLFEKSKHRHHLVGTEENGIIIGLSLEGRFFTVLDGEVISRINPKVFSEQSTKDEYINPGGDTLWPAPEGSCLGYEYSTGSWRVPPGITGACYRVVDSGRNRVHVSAEIDLVNNMGTGIPAIFTRQVQVETKKGFLALKSIDGIAYAGAKVLGKNMCMLGPWSLSQFDCKEGCEVILPSKSVKDVWDLYGPSDEFRSFENGFCRIKTEGNRRFQVGISSIAGWIEYRDPGKNLRIRRQAEPLEEGFLYFDIADRPPEEKPQGKGIRYSVYNDAGGFMEIEAAGGTPASWKQDTVSKISVTTFFQKD
ncbi:MAG TPA: hypothetical protein PKN36_07510 [bacterium]|nr:hypothetical protein [bacterium]